ncbi:FtsX-like permease family protein [Candidatus Saccharibacteria bacterium]|nr:FtsX-like permease family protein [Candidatus Saccharibacteria bacterium]
MSKRKLDSKAFARQKQNRRKWLTFVRMCRYGINNFSRNAWLTIAATAVMTITLLIIFTAVVARSILAETVAQLRDKVPMSIYLKTETTDPQADAIKQQLQKLSSVRSVDYVSAEDAKAQQIQENKKNIAFLEASKEATNRNPGILHVTIQDINDTSQLSDFVNTNQLLKKSIDSARAPSFAGERKASIESIGQGISFAEKIGLIASLVFVAISSLIIFNTIRMAIFNRKEEIQMMKLIGADRSFIRGPFLVEALVYGFIAAVIATGLGLAGLYASSKSLSNFFSVQATINYVTSYGVFVLLGMIGLGAFIGIVSSLLATRRYLKL